MKLYITDGSPYARIARIIVLEKRLENRVEIVFPQTRTRDSPYYRINPSGRVPFLERDDGQGLEESAVICRYLDHLDGAPAFDLPAGDPIEALRLGALATSMLDGLSVWLRERRRPQNEQSATILTHETERARRLVDHWEIEIDNPLMHEPLNLVQVTLTCALGLETRNAAFRWRDGHPKLCAWFDRMAERPSVAQTISPEGR